MDVSATGYVILGMLRDEARSGYEIKQVVDRTTRFFWAASYGQIYPELRRLAKAGLIEGEADPEGGRRRTAYRLTASGRRELRRWLAAEPEVFEMRDEGLLKLFFAAAAPGTAADAIRAKRAHHAEKLSELRAIEPIARQAADGYPLMVLGYGAALSEASIRWCDEALAELEAGAGDAASGKPKRTRRSA